MVGRKGLTDLQEEEGVVECEETGNEVVVVCERRVRYGENETRTRRKVWSEGG